MSHTVIGRSDQISQSAFPFFQALRQVEVFQQALVYEIIGCVTQGIKIAVSLTMRGSSLFSLEIISAAQLYQQQLCADLQFIHERKSQFAAFFSINTLSIHHFYKRLQIRHALFASSRCLAFCCLRAAGR